MPAGKEATTDFGKKTASLLNSALSTTDWPDLAETADLLKKPVGSHRRESECRSLPVADIQQNLSARANMKLFFSGRVWESIRIPILSGIRRKPEIRD